MPEIDVIAQWNADGTITPKRIRIHTDDDVYDYTLKGAVPVTHGGGEMVHGRYITVQTKVWECWFVVRGVRRVVYLFFDPDHGGKWDISQGE